MKEKKELKEKDFKLSCMSDNCLCKLCYEQEFCNRCETCRNGSNKKESCNAFEGAYNY